jgi:hypothetical protein
VLRNARGGTLKCRCKVEVECKSRHVRYAHEGEVSGATDDAARYGGGACDGGARAGRES